MLPKAFAFRLAVLENYGYMPIGIVPAGAHGLLEDFLGTSVLGVYLNPKALQVMVYELWFLGMLMRRPYLKPLLILFLTLFPMSQPRQMGFKFKDK